MKKLVFGLIATVLLSVSGFANNTKDISDFNHIKTNKSIDQLNLIDSNNIFSFENNFDFFGTCYVTLGFYDSDGNKIAERTLQIEGVNSADECSRIADEIAKQL
ncbi:hypothetical protein FIA58_011695 [Flavobacterium jejuense]|uniref:Uncharacterized protein n=1 Tax=Flavobacterium jejuense TaxID=1544455 RepID=A0ABX0IS39_9FLAO|nr:hypothetical protein [Flavobacterium jejuense]NHN26343.1 hypothetical protein [Flavobacterium jejuense]